MINKHRDHRTQPLFPEMFPFGGHLDEANRFVKLNALVPWDELIEEYNKTLSDGRGRPATDSRLVIGLLILKHLMKVGDREIIQQLSENVYFQFFCGWETFHTREMIDPSVLTYARRRLTKVRFEIFEQGLIRKLYEKGIIHPKRMYVDATVFPVDMAHPTDVNLLEKGRRWVVGFIKRAGRSLGKTIRTYSRKAREVFLGFSKTKKKTKEKVRKTLKKTLQFLKRNLHQAEEVLKELEHRGEEIQDQAKKKLQIIQKMFEQQREMYRSKIHRATERIVSLSRPHIRPIIRGKNKAEVEFGLKASLSLVDGFCFSDHLSPDPFNESQDLKSQIHNFESRFGKKPESISGDRIYATRENRIFLEEYKVMQSFLPLGRASETESPGRKLFRKKEHKRRSSLMEGIIGHAKEHFNMNRIRAKTPDTEKLFVNLGLLSMNLHTALKRI